MSSTFYGKGSEQETTIISELPESPIYNGNIPVVFSLFG